MKKIYLIIALIFIKSIIFAQNYFQTTIGEPNTREVVYSVIQNTNNDYFFCGFQMNVETNAIGSYIAKLSETGEFLKSESLNIPDSSLATSDILQLDNDNFLTITILSPLLDFEKNNYIILNWIDDELNLINEKKIKFPIDSMGITSINFEKGLNNEIICYGNTSKQNIGLSFIYKLTPEGDSISFKILPTGIWDLFVNNTGKIFYIGPMVNQDITVLNYSDISVDTTFEFINSTGIPSCEWMFIESLNDNEFVTSNLNCVTNKVNVTKFDSNFNLLERYDNIGYNDYNIQTLQLNAMDINSENEVMIGTHFPGISSNYFNIAKTDSILNPIWQKFYEVDLSAYWLILLATNDGGFMIIGDEDPSSGFSDVIIIKGDSLGNITNINGISAFIKVKECLVYPNPSTGIFNIIKGEQLENTIIEIYDITGKLIIQKKFTENQITIDLTNNSKGSYFYNIQSDNMKIESGQMIVN